MENKAKKILTCVALLLLAAISFTFIADKASSPETYSGIISSIDSKIDTVMGLTAASTVASAVVSAVPDDTATPISEKLADFAEYFLVVLCVLYSEKYLLTVAGFAAFRIIIPISCVLGIISIWRRTGNFRSVAIKLTIIGLALYCLTPVSVGISDSIYGVYKTSIDSTISAAETITGGSEDISENSGAAQEDENNGSLATVFSSVSNTVVNLLDKASDILRNFVEALAVLIVTSCVIPLIALIFFLWLIKTLTGIDIRAKVTRLPASAAGNALPDKVE